MSWRFLLLISALSVLGFASGCANDHASKTRANLPLASANAAPAATTSASVSQVVPVSYNAPVPAAMDAAQAKAPATRTVPKYREPDGDGTSGWHEPEHFGYGG
jgi:hypothetical protein